MLLTDNWRNISITLIYPQDPFWCLKLGNASVRRWAVIFAVAGAVWMVLVLCFGPLRLAVLSNYPGAFAARWVRYRGIAPSTMAVCAFNVWLVLTSSIQWVAIGLVLRTALRCPSKLMHSPLA